MVEEGGSVRVVPAVVVQVRVVRVCIMCVSGGGVKWVLGDG